MNLALEQYLALVREWNIRVNLVSRKDIANLETHHLEPCLVYQRLQRLHDHERIIDIGSGGGFPGIVNAILFPTSTFVLIDSTRKKVTALQDMIKRLGLKNAEAIWSRVEDLAKTPDYRGKFDHATARAVAPLSTLWHWSKPLLKSGGSLEAMKGGDLTTELAELNAPYTQQETIVSVVK